RGGPMSASHDSIFTDDDFNRAVDALDLVLQDCHWLLGDTPADWCLPPGETPFAASDLYRALRAKGITRALADELFRRLKDRGIFTDWYHTRSAGYTRLLEQTTHCLVTTRKRWEDWLLPHRRQRSSGAVKPPNGPVGSEPNASPDAEALPPSSKPATINDRMLQTLQRDRDSLGWSQRKWAEHLHCSTGAIAKAPAWQHILV